MKSKPNLLSRTLLTLFIAAALTVTGCSSSPPMPDRERFEGSSPADVLAYYQALTRLSAAELNRERSLLAALPPSAETQLRQAMLLGHTRAGGQDLARAQALLDNVVKSPEAAAVGLRPLARLLAENYGERQRLEGQFDKQSQQLKDSQRKAVELQEKLDALADIERTLPSRSRPGRPGKAGEAR